MKSGIFSSEFWLGLLSISAPALLELTSHSGNPWISLASMAFVSIYTMARTKLKLDLPVLEAKAQAIIQAPAQAPVQAPLTDSYLP